MDETHVSSLTKDQVKALVHRALQSNNFDARSAAEELLRFSPKEARLALGDLVNSPVAMAAIIENSITFDGTGAPSLLAVLEPSEAAQVITISRQVFPLSALFLDHSAENYKEISKEYAMEIMRTGTRLKRNLLINKCTASHPSVKKWKEGPWFLCYDEVGIHYEGILTYLDSIAEADRDKKWKMETIESLGRNMLALVQMKTGKVIDICRKIDDSDSDNDAPYKYSLADELEEFLETCPSFQTLRNDILDRHLSTISEVIGFEVSLQKNIPSLSSAMDELLEVDLDSDDEFTEDDIEAQKEAETELEALFREGFNVEDDAKISESEVDVDADANTIIDITEDETKD